MLPPVSAIVITWNNEQCLEHCLRSLEADLHADDELLVIDNANSSATAALVARHAPRVRFVQNKENLTYARAANQGVSLTTGDLVWILNDDIEVLPGCRDALVHAFRTHPDAAVCGPLLLEPGGEVSPLSRLDLLTPGQVVDRLAPTPRLRLQWLLDLWVTRRAARRTHSTRYTRADDNCVEPVGLVTGAAMMVSRHRFLSVGGMDARFRFYFEDYDLCLSLAQRGWRNYLVGSARAVHMEGVSSSPNLVFCRESLLAGAVLYLEKHYGRGTACFARPLLSAHMLGSALRSMLPRSPGRGGRLYRKVGTRAWLRMARSVLRNGGKIWRNQ